ncbi:MAG: hypothetical protein LQ352_004709 [Teloschistes flavicans]|nr:MAG: hypothetical protein LQ352_004709 [Teloschistes flavicans]
MGKRKAQSQNPADESGDEAPPQGGKKLFVLKPPKPPGQGPSPTNQPSTRMAGAAPPNQFGTTFGLPNNVSGVPPPPSPSDASSLTTLSSSPSPPPIGPRGPDDRLPPVAQATSSGFSAPLAPSALSTPPVLSAPTGPVAPTTPPAPSAPSAPSAPLKVSGPSAHFVPSAGQPYSSGPTQYTISPNIGVSRRPVETSTKLPPQDLFHPRNKTHYGECVNKVLFWAYGHRELWNTVLACYFQTGERSPKDVASPFWSFACGFSGAFRRDWRLLDYHNFSGLSVTPYWLGPEEVDANLLLQATGGDRVILEDAMTRWSRDPQNFDTCQAILRGTFWTDEFLHDEAWYVMDGILKMAEGTKKSEKMAQAKKESPLLFAACLKDPWCGMVRETVKRKLPNDEEVEDTYEVEQRGSGPVRIHRTTKFSPKRQKLNAEYDYKMMDLGRPTQFHAVPPEERAIDANGNQLPWALEWPDDHPNARGQKRRPVETGPFGKSMRRKGSSRGSLRATRTATPAKKESSAVDGFMRGLEEDKRRAELYGEGIDPTASNATQQDIMTAPANKEPVQVSLYGFSSPTQWAAISHYEKVSGGMICEDYDRHPPIEARRFPTAFSSPHLASRRALTPLEKKMSMAYKGGEAWIRVTFDSAEAAERACHFSPHLIQGHWVYAEPYFDGVVPNHDKPIPLRPEDRQGDTTAAKPSHIPSHKTTQSLGPAFARNLHVQQAQTNATIPRSFVSNTVSQQDTPQRSQPESSSPSTASSATATAPSAATGSTNLRQRIFGPQSNEQSPLGQQSGSDAPGSASHAQQQQGNNFQGMTHFPDIPRIPLRPAHEAFLPQPTFTQRWLTYFEHLGLIPGDVIGNGVPRLENGDFDYANASFYWRFFYWFDTSFGTDICGLRDE